LSEPNGKMHTKTFYRNGKVSVKWWLEKTM
jgi:hypothetical protein